MTSLPAVQVTIRFKPIESESMALPKPIRITYVEHPTAGWQVHAVGSHGHFDELPEGVTDRFQFDHQGEQQYVQMDRLITEAIASGGRAPYRGWFAYYRETRKKAAKRYGEFYTGGYEITAVQVSEKPPIKVKTA